MFVSFCFVLQRTTDEDETFKACHVCNLHLANYRFESTKKKKEKVSALQKPFFFSGGKVTLIIFKCVVFKVRFLSFFSFSFFLNLYLPLGLQFV